MKDYGLVKRLCACGCGKSWKCMPTSKSIYFSEVHIPQEEQLILERSKRAKTFGVYGF